MTAPLMPLALPALPDVLAATRVVALPMRVRFRGVTVRECALIEGPAGWGEFAPFVEYETQEAATWLASSLEAAWLPAPSPLRQQIPLNATVPAVAAHEVEGVLARYDGAIHEVKIKVAEAGLPFEESLAADSARLAAVRQLLPKARLKIDANGGWSESQAVRALTELSAYDLIYAEQPTEGIESLARVRESLRERDNPLLIAADEAVRKATDPLRVARAGAADLLIIKAAPLGGVRRALAVVQQAGLPAVVSSALESSVGISTGAALAATLPELPYGCGLGTVSLFEQDVAAQPLVARNGMLPVHPVEPDATLLSRLAASEERTAWWYQRITACYQHLHQQGHRIGE